MSRLDRVCRVEECRNSVWAKELCRKHYYRLHTHGDVNKVLVNQSPVGAPKAFIEELFDRASTDCIIWPFARNNEGYAIWDNGITQSRLVSRQVCERIHGDPPSPQHQAAHSCGHGHLGCISPWHLSWKSPSENIADQYMHGTRAFGERSKQKLKTADVIEIRKLGMLGLSQREIANRYSVSQSLVGRIINRKLWTSVEPGTVLQHTGRAA